MFCAEPAAHQIGKTAAGFFNRSGRAQDVIKHAFKLFNGGVLRDQRLEIEQQHQRGELRPARLIEEIVQRFASGQAFAHLFGQGQKQRRRGREGSG